MRVFLLIILLFFVIGCNKKPDVEDLLFRFAIPNVTSECVFFVKGEFLTIPNPPFEIRAFAILKNGKRIELSSNTVVSPVGMYWRIPIFKADFEKFQVKNRDEVLIGMDVWSIGDNPQKIPAKIKTHTVDNYWPIF